MMPIPAKAYMAVCALLGGAVVIANSAFGQSAGGEAPQRVVQPGDNGAGPTAAAPKPAVEPSVNAAEASLAAVTDDSANAPVADGEIDAGGHPWSADLHASTKGKTKDGYWRMKVGVSRPDPLAGYPVADTGTSVNGAVSEAGATATTETAASTDGDDDEFAAFRAAAATSDATDAAAAASVPARQLSDADLGALCNQAAVKLGDPTPIKEIIGKYVPEGEVAHSRNIPADKREEFAAAVEAKAGIQFAG